MSGLLDYVAEAIRLLRDQADAVHELHNAPGETTFEGEPEAEAAYAELERVANGLETEIAARLRGDGKQGQAVAWFPTNGNGELIRNYGDGSAVFASETREKAEQAKRCHLGATGPVIPLYTRPQPAAPAPVAGDAVRTLPAKWRASIDAASPHRPQDLRPIRFVLDLEAALSTQPAPSEQVAASVVVPDGLINRVEEAARRVDNGHALRRIPADPTDVDLVLGEVLAWLKGEPAPFWVPAAAPVAPEREG